MNKFRKILLLSKWLFVFVLLTSVIATSARAQTPAVGRTTDQESDATSITVPVSVSTPPLGPSSLIPSRTRTHIDQSLITEFYKAWQISGSGTNGREAVVLVFRMEDGTYTGQSQGFSNEYMSFTFKWNPAAVAIVHTHPNGSVPTPSEQDKRVADQYGVPNFTITISGMYEYDPATKRISKVLDGLAWLNLSSWPQGIDRPASVRNPNQ